MAKKPVNVIRTTQNFKASKSDAETKAELKQHGKEGSKKEEAWDKKFTTSLKKK